jgi:signal recognition particle subunit SRP54
MNYVIPGLKFGICRGSTSKSTAGAAKTMFENLSERLLRTLKNIRGQGRLTEENIKEALREVRVALLEADVALPVVREFINQVRDRAIGQEVMRSLVPGQMLIKIVHEEMIKVMGEVNAELDLRAQAPAIVLMAGLQGSGKTTSAAKLAYWLKERKHKSVMLASCDVYRPAAIEQLKTLANQVGVEFFPCDPAQPPVAIAEGAVEAARRQFMDVLILDTAGRLHVDDEMMAEIKTLHLAVKPVETLFVVDSMTGQDAANTARAFADALPLTGVVLTKADGDARGGAALSIRFITGKPIKFLGVGEKNTALEAFHPDRLASRILGMGDVLSLVEEVEQRIDREKAQRLAEKVRKGKRFDLEDFREQIEQMMAMGGLATLLDKLPGIATLPPGVREQTNDKQIRRLVAIINSMTAQERRSPEIINGSRKRRIAAGSGTQVQEVNKLLKQFGQVQKMMKKMKGGAMAKMLRGLRNQFPGGITGGVPPF